MVMGPVIDITRLPRYGVLAPPLPREPRRAGQTIAYDRATGVFTRNRGALREALEHKSGGVPCTVMHTVCGSCPQFHTHIWGGWVYQ
jgi:hypothetical protein